MLKRNGMRTEPSTVNCQLQEKHQNSRGIIQNLECPRDNIQCTIPGCNSKLLSEGSLCLNKCPKGEKSTETNTEMTHTLELFSLGLESRCYNYAR